MSKKTGQPWYRKGTDSWYVWHSGRQVRLATGRANKAEAYARFAELLDAPVTEEARPPLTVTGLIAAYRAHVRQRVKASTYTSYDVILKQLVEAFGDRVVGAVSADDLEAWARAQPWSQTTRRYGLTVAAVVYRWAVRSRLIDANPIRVLNRPPGRSRGADVIIDDALHERILGVSSPQFAQFITVVRATGARPGEVARLEAAHIVWEASCWRLPDHKTVGKTGRERTIFMPDSVVPIVKALAEQRTEGPLFRNTLGKPWTKTGWKQAMARAQQRLGLANRPLTSGYRHTFATDALASGVPDTHVAELLGHTSTAMVAKHYGHLAAKARTLRASLDRFRGNGADSRDGTSGSQSE